MKKIFISLIVAIKLYSSELSNNNLNLLNSLDKLPLPVLVQNGQQLTSLKPTNTIPVIKNLEGLLKTPLRKIIMGYLSAKDKYSLSLCSKAFSKLFWLDVPALILSLKNINKDCLKNTQEQVKRVKKILLYERFDKSKMLAEQIKLLSQIFLLLEHLEINYKSLTPTEIKSFIGANKFKNLKTLNLSNNPEIGDIGLDLLLKGSFFSSLKVLRLRDANLTLLGIRLLSTLGKFNALEALDIADNTIGDQGLALLADSTVALRLKYIHLCKTGLTSKSVPLLTKFKQIETLILGFNTINNDGVRLLLQLPLISQLKYLYLQNVGLTNEGMSAFIEAQKFKELRMLDLSCNDIDDKGIAVLNDAPFSDTLHRLELFCKGVTTKGLELLTKLNKFSSFEFIDIARILRKKP